MSDELTEAERAELELDLQDYWHEADLTGPPLGKVIASVVRIKAAARREALLEAREDIRARRQNFRRLNADPQYLAAMDDAFGLVNNRIAEPERDEEGGR